jgi:anti-sigma-K factor RskA
LRNRVLASVGGGSKPGWWNAWRPAWAMGALAAGLAVAAFVFYSDKQTTTAELAAANQKLSAATVEAARGKQILDFIDQPETRAVGFSGTEPAAPPKGNFFVNPKSGVLMIASRLPKLEPGKTYQMWVIPKGKKPLPAGLFHADESGSAIHLQPGPVDVASIAAVAVSVEPESGSAQPTTKPIIVAPMTGM